MTLPKSFRIVIAEDESLVAEMIAGVLQDLGHTVVGKATDGHQAVELTKQAQPDAVIMDIKMPGIDGLEAARQIAASCPTPVVVLTAFETAEMLEEAGAAGISAYLTKPPNAREMERALTLAIARFDDFVTLQRMNTELTKALNMVNTLHGLLPICANCKKIRDDHGQWHDVEAYIASRSAAEFTHGICPDCLAALYSEYMQ
jgi:AmiR/NasT family two-component response regulator